MENILVCIDDTDNIDSRGTGELAAMLADIIEEKKWGTSTPVTRHQLLIHPDIEYTSHNSSMCFEAEIEAEYLADITCFSMDFLLNESAEGSDPGLEDVGGAHDRNLPARLPASGGRGDLYQQHPSVRRCHPSYFRRRPTSE